MQGRSGRGRFFRSCAVTLSRYRFYPALVLQVPGDRQTKPGCEIVFGFPTKLTADFGRVNGVAPIMSRAIFYERDQVPRIAAQFRTQFVDQIADSFYDAQIRPFVVPTDVVGLAGPALLQHAPKRRGVIQDEQPIADVQAIAVDRNRLALDEFLDNHGNEFLRELIWAVIVRA